MLQIEEIVKLCLTNFQCTLNETKSEEYVKQALKIFLNKDGSQELTVNNKKYILNKNVYIVAFGKAASSMVIGAEEVLAENLISGIASVPIKSEVFTGLKTKFYFGAKNNLPDENSVLTSEKIVNFIKEINLKKNQIILFLISGGGSALLSSPIKGITLKEKLEVIQLLTENGANIKQLNEIRIALSNVKGGKLAQLCTSTKIISLIISDIIGDPINLISSGPTVLTNINYKNVKKILEDLNILNKISNNVLTILKKYKQFNVIENFNIDINNLIICNNSVFLNKLAINLQKQIKANIFVVNTELDGNASNIGKKLAQLISKLNQNETNIYQAIQEIFHFNFLKKYTENSNNFYVLLFGGETTVNFSKKNLYNAKGGRNQELILSTFKNLNLFDFSNKDQNLNFALFSLATDGQDGPTDASGAFITSEDVLLFKKDFKKNISKLNECLINKNSYIFWSNFWCKGKNLIKFEKTNINLMDVQIVFISFNKKE